MSVHIKDAVTQLEKMFIGLSERGFGGKSRATWPVIINRSIHRQSVSYEYQYSKSFFTNLQLQHRILISYELIKSKSNRLTFVKLIIDKHMSGEIDIFMYHFGMFLVYRDLCHREKEDFAETSIGKKRAQFVQTLPISRFMSTDDFISAIWSQQIEYRETDTEEYQRNPFMENVRILFTNEQFSAWTGRQYSEDVTWVEPISYKLNLECRKWSEEKDPMAPNKIPEGWVQGAIILHEESSGLRHYVNGVPVHAGSALQVKFGNGWISGRYEWSFDGKSKIQVHCNDDVIYISEGHQVRVRG
ncbi:hypothetical protein [Desulfosporosinus sp. OT]|uniref:hypothetical protein n=1 Tax=Desulfosporosinus sp. OT TaxID=913865 RepID=UPI000223A4D5|nr:hypothetical protein [Desulfosporosinus sp. OT]EGW37071.1 hypothetical protein DOT_4971 [Desulfosporosinus sp. OT]